VANSITVTRGAAEFQDTDCVTCRILDPEFVVTLVGITYPVCGECLDALQEAISAAGATADGGAPAEAG
jgi:hypothetical protein